jgi:predicted RNase H-like HicB family nuclease
LPWYLKNAGGSYEYNLFWGGKMTFKGTIKIEQEENWFVATCLENNIVSQGKTIDEAMVNLREAIALYYDDETAREELDALQNDQVDITRLEMAL